MSALSRVRLDEFTTAMLATVMLGFLLPCRGTSAVIFGGLAAAAIGLLFFLQGARLSRAAIIAGALHWRLHLVIFVATFVLFPVVGLALRPLSGTLLTPPFLCTLPSTVQDSVAFTSIAGGNVAAALCSASASSMFGVFLTPLLAGLVLHAHGALSLDALRSIGLEMVLPFIAGQLLQPWIGSWVQARRRALAVVVDRGSVLLVVYTVFSGATLSGIWHQLAFGPLMALFAAAGCLLALMLAITALAGRGLGFSREDQIAIIFCGSKKKPRRRDPDGEFAVCRPRLGPHRPAVDGVLPDPGHGLRRARPALCQGCEIARNSHLLRWGFRGQSYSLSEISPFCTNAAGWAVTTSAIFQLQRGLVPNFTVSGS
jgi:sodium/bile acid cotransporter 7